VIGRVGIATGYGLGDLWVGVRVPVGARIFSMSSTSVLEPTQPSIQWVPGVKLPGRETNHYPPTRADVKKVWIYTSTPPYRSTLDIGVLGYIGIF
jgi:hypothetical protein